MKHKILEKIRASKLYALFRRLRYYLHLKPMWHRFLAFIKHYFGGLYDRIDRHHVFLLGGGLAFSLFVCIIPLTLIIFWILGRFLDSAEMEVQIVTLIETLIPYETYAQFVKEIIFDRIQEVIRYRNIAGFLGLIGLFIAASGFASSLRTILNKVFGTDLDINIFLGKLRDFAVIIIAILLFLASTMLLPLLELFRSIATETPYLQYFRHPVFESVTASFISLFIMYFIFSVLYKFIPIVKIRKRSVLVGSMWAAILWVAAKLFFGYYLTQFQTFPRIYGAYALGIVVAFWIYYTSVVFIIGAEIGKLFDERVSLRIKDTEATDISEVVE